MRSRLLKRSLNAIGIGLFLLGGAWVVPGHAQLNAQLAACDGINDGASLALAKSCAAHIGCNMALKLKTDCSQAMGFLAKLRSNLSGNRGITNNDVFEANMPVLTADEKLNRHIASVQRLVRDAPYDPSNGTLDTASQSGSRFYYEGGLDGERRMHGVGVFIVGNGGMGRGRRVNGSAEGLGQLVAPDGAFFVGTFLNGKLHGSGAYQHSNGVVLVGEFSEAHPVGLIESTHRSGVTQKTRYDAQGKVLAAGPFAAPGEIAQLPKTDAPLGIAAEGNSSTPGSADYQPPRWTAPSAAGGSANVPGSPDYQPPRRPASSTQADDPKALGGSYRP
jgi:hypothetical protein